MPKLFESRCSTFREPRRWWASSSANGARSMCSSTTPEAAIKGLTEGLAKEVARYGIRIICLAPGLLEDGVGRNLPDYRLADYLKHCSLGRLGGLDEVASFAAFLVSDANSYMSGETVVMDGGLETNARCCARFAKDHGLDRARPIPNPNRLLLPTTPYHYQL